MRGRRHEDGSDSEQLIRQAFGIPDNYGVLSVIAMGYKAKDRKLQDEEKLLWQAVHVNQF